MSSRSRIDSIGDISRNQFLHSTLKKNQFCVSCVPILFPTIVESIRALNGHDAQLVKENETLKTELEQLKAQFSQQQKDMEALKAMVKELAEGKK